jgi:hypothetical protein
MVEKKIRPTTYHTVFSPSGDLAMIRHLDTALHIHHDFEDYLEYNVSKMKGC